jgi:hypothetical protein
MFKHLICLGILHLFNNAKILTIKQRICWLLSVYISYLIVLSRRRDGEQAKKVDKSVFLIY